MKQLSIWTSTPKAEIKSKEVDFKLKKGETIDTLIITARKLVEEKLGKYKDTSKCVLDEESLIKFFDETPEDAVIGIDTETTRFKCLYRYTSGNISL